MTGEKNRFTTTEKLWKLNDETLTTPQHDEMVLWLLNKDNIIKLFPEAFPYREVIKIESEVPINANANKFIVGYWDIVVSFSELIGYGYGCREYPIYKRYEYYIEVKPTIQSFGAVLRQLKTYINYFDRFVDPQRIERKIILFTRDVQFKDAFESQGIKVIEYVQK